MQPDQEPIDYDQPVAYDPAGKPLYYRPETTPPIEPDSATVTVANDSVPPQDPAPIVHEDDISDDAKSLTEQIAEESVAMLNGIEGKTEQEIPEAIRARHEESVGLYPELNLALSEYVIIRVQRHNIGLIRIWLGTIAVFVIMLLCTVLISNQIDTESARLSFGLIGLVISLLAFVFGALMVWVYLQNRFYVTNERVISHVQQTLFAVRKKSVGLDRIEEVSYQQDGVLQALFDYGTIKLATVGDETTYPFTFVADPVDQLAVINNAIQEYDRIHGIRRTMKP